MLKALQITGALLLAGGPVFLELIWRPALAAAPEEKRAAWDAHLARRVRAGADLGFILVTIPASLNLLLIAADLAQSSVLSAAALSKLAAVLLHTERGPIVAVRILLAAGLWLAGRRISRPSLPGNGGGRTMMRLLGGVAAAGLFATFSLSGHAATVAQSKAAAALVDLAHFLTASVWGGGIWAFAFLPWRALAEENGLPAARVLVRRFTILGLAAVALIVATGLYMATQYLWGLPALFETRYGRELLWKHVFLAVVLAAAMDNRYNVRLRLARAAAEPRRLVRSLRNNVWVEAAAILVIVLIAGFLTVTSAEARKPVSVVVTISDMRYQPSTLAIPRRSPVRLTVINQDRVTHSLAVRNFPYEGPRTHLHDPDALPAGDLVVYVPPRSRNTVVFVALEFGTYRVADILEDFEDRGLTGTLVVK